MKTRIVVLGVPRSGTSLITEVVHRWGAYVGKERELKPADERNSHGFWERIDLKGFNASILGLVNASNDFPPAIEDAAVLKDIATDPPYRQESLRLIASMDKESDIWVWKDPKMSLLLPFWKELLDDKTVYIISVRSPLEVVDSYRKLEGDQFTEESFPWSFALLHWHVYIWQILQHTEDISKKIFIEYEALINDPLTECTKINQFLNQYCTPPPNQSPIAQMVQAVDSNLHHNRRNSLINEHATNVQNSLYQFLRKKVIQPDLPFPAEELAPDRDWREQMIEEGKRRNYTG